MCDRGGSWRVLQKWVAIWGISTTHFDPAAARDAALRQRRQTPLEELLVIGSTIGSSKLKARLYREGLKNRTCEICGQGESWRGRRMSLVLDHINGDRHDNRLENLRVVCPNCNATLDTHCGRNARLHGRTCERCGATFSAGTAKQRFCSRACGVRHERLGRPNPAARRVERPPYEQLMGEIETLGWSAVGRRYGVSDNAIRKWVRAYEQHPRAEDEAA